VPFLSKDRPGLGRRSDRAVRVNEPGPIAAGTGLIRKGGDAAAGELERNVQQQERLMTVQARDEDDAVAEAYGHVADGCRKALMVSDLPRRRRRVFGRSCTPLFSSRDSGRYLCGDDRSRVVGDLREPLQKSAVKNSMGTSQALAISTSDP
jgi:hypothetical protein